MRINKSIKLFLLAFVLAVVFTVFRKGEVNSTTTDLLTVITYNIGTIDGRRLRPEKIVATIRKNATPDLLLLQEVPNEKFAIKLAESFGLPFIFSALIRPQANMDWPLYPVIRSPGPRLSG